MMGPIADSVAELIAAGGRAVAQVRREVGHDPEKVSRADAIRLGGAADRGPGDLVAYVEALEAKVREQAMALRIAGITVTRQDAPYPAVSRPY